MISIVSKKKKLEEFGEKSKKLFEFTFISIKQMRSICLFQNLTKNLLRSSVKKLRVESAYRTKK
jgi:hypothetical protein